MQLNMKDILNYVRGKLYVNSVRFVVEYPNEKISRIEDNKLVILFRNCPSMENYWNVEDICGYYLNDLESDVGRIHSLLRQLYKNPGNCGLCDCDADVKEAFDRIYHLSYIYARDEGE